MPHRTYRAPEMHQARASSDSSSSVSIKLAVPLKDLRFPSCTDDHGSHLCAIVPSVPTLWSARQAAKRLGVGEHTARRRAARAAARGDANVMRVTQGWYASEDWWRDEFTRHPVRRGRPRQTVRSVQPPRPDACD